MAMTMKAPVRQDAEVALLSTFDTAIDWDASYPEEYDLEAKLTAHRDGGFDPANVTFKEGETPTLFVFHDPRVSLYASRVRASLMGIKSFVKEGVSDDDVVVVWNVLAKGYREGEDFTEWKRETKGSKNLNADTLQIVDSNGALRELGSYLLTEIIKSKTLDTTAQKK